MKGQGLAEQTYPVPTSELGGAWGPSISCDGPSSYLEGRPLGLKSRHSWLHRLSS